jgi:hypothetical protein
MLAGVAAALDAWVVAQNVLYRADGLPALKPCRIRVLGQSALLEAGSLLHLNLTNDVDVYADYEHAIEVEFRRLLARHGKELDALGHEIWMPRETRYDALFTGEYVTMQLADMDSVLLSKALKAPVKNRALLVDYLAAGASDRFLGMAKRYRVDLEQFL